MPVILTTAASDLPETPADRKVNSSNDGGANLLPTDDQLDKLVDNLCDSFPSLKMKLDRSPNSMSSKSQDISSSATPKTDDMRSNSSDTTSTTSSALVRLCVSVEAVDGSLRKKALKSAKKLPTPNLNISMMKCQRTLQSLRERRKSLEAYVRLPPQVLSCTTRLPESPTRVDRLIFEVNQERLRVIGTIAALNSAIQAFAEISTKDDLRYMLERFRKAIIDVMKERYGEVEAVRIGSNLDLGNRATKLALLIDQVDLLVREADTALWCLKQQVLKIKSLKCISKASSTLSMNNHSIAETTMKKSAVVVPAKKIANFEHLATRHSPDSSLPPKIIGNNRNGNSEGSTRSQKKSRGGQQVVKVAGPHQQQATNIYQLTTPSLSSSSRLKKSSTMQLFAQQQRAEMFHRYSSALKSNHKDSTIK